MAEHGAPRHLVALAAIGASVGLALAAAPATPAEYDVKAAMLYNVTRYVRWNAGAGKDSEASPIVIGVLGRNPFGSALSDLVSNRAAGGRPLLVRHFETPVGVEVCHVLFIARSESEIWRSLLPALERAGVMSVGDSERFVEHGGVMGFVVRGGKVRLQVNLDAARRAGLAISSNLLRIAEVMRD
jgi:hypothetical protein